MNRSGALFAPIVSVALAVLGCSGAKPAVAKAPLVMHEGPACGLVAPAGLDWIVDARPREIASIVDLIPAIALVVPEARFASFAASHGGVDLRRVDELCVAHYEGRTDSGDDATHLAIAKTAFDPDRVERAFTEQSTRILQRSYVDRDPSNVRIVGDVHGKPEELAMFSRDLLLLSRGASRPLRAAEAFAIGKLKKSKPALDTEALARAATALGSAPLRVFFAGPFEDEAAHGLGGLLRATTAVGLSASFAGAPSKVAVRMTLIGAWGADANAAGERLAAAVDLAVSSGLGKLLGLDRPTFGPRVHVEADALVLDATVDGMTLARGLHDALDAEVDDIMRR